MGKSLKDPNGPKKPLTAYFAWQKANRPRMIKSMPVGYSFKQLSQAFAKEWKGMGEEDKKPFEDTYRTEMERYRKLMNAYKLTASYKAFQSTVAQQKVTDVSKTKFRKDPNAPKKPLSGYFMFLGEKRQSVKDANPDLGHKDALRKLGEMWSAMSEADKKIYNDKSQAAKKTYEAELEKYKQSEEYKTYQAEKAEWKQAKKSKLKLVKKRAARNDDEDEGERPAKRAKRAKTKSPKKTKKKSKKKSKTKSGKPKAPKKSARKSLVPKKTARKARKSKKKSKKKGGRKA